MKKLLILLVLSLTATGVYADHDRHRNKRNHYDRERLYCHDWHYGELHRDRTHRRKRHREHRLDEYFYGNEYNERRPKHRHHKQRHRKYRGHKRRHHNSDSSYWPYYWDAGTGRNGKVELYF